VIAGTAANGSGVLSMSGGKERAVNLWQWFFGGEERDNRNRREQDAKRKISPAMPMSAVGAQLAGEEKSSLTERELREASDEGPR